MASLTTIRSPMALMLGEWVVLLFGVFALSLFLFFDIPLRNPWELYFSKLKFGAIWYAIGLVVSLFVLRLRHIRAADNARRKVAADSKTASKSRARWEITWQSFRLMYLRPQVLVRDLRLVHLLSLLFVVFINLKHLIPFINGAIYDRAFYDFEQSIFGNGLLTQRFIQILGVESAGLISSAYTSWYAYLACLIYLMILQRNEQLAREFAAAFAVLWFLSILLVYFIPTWGPCFFQPELLESLPETAVSKLQAGLWTHKLFVDSHPAAASGVFAISGFPSVHFGATLLGSYYLNRVHNILGLFSWIFALITFISTIYFGWHYVADDLAAVAVAFLSIAFARRFCSPGRLSESPLAAAVEKSHV